MIDGVETWGDDRPISQQQLKALIGYLNRSYAINGAHLEEGSYFLTMFIWHNNYHDFLLDYSGKKQSPQTFLKHHAQVMAGLLHDANIFLKGPSTLKNFILRRLIVVENDVQTPHSHHFGYLVDGFKDSDGVWALDKPYDPIHSDYFSRKDYLDTALIHEWGHRVLSLPDEYALDVSLPPYGDISPSSATLHYPDDNSLIQEYQKTSAFSQAGSIATPLFSPADIPYSWQTYTTSRRNDNFGNSLMNLAKLYLGPHETWQLSRRLNTKHSHDFAYNVPEQSWNFPDEVPVATILELGKQYAGAAVTIYRSTGTYQRKYLGSQAIFTDTVDVNGRVDIGNPFNHTAVRVMDGSERTLVPSFNGAILIKVTTQEGRIYLRWMDVREFNLAFWLNLKDQAVIRLKLFPKEAAPYAVDWQTEYFSPDGRKVFP